MAPLSIDPVHFTPWASLEGGLVIGLSAALYVLGVGRIAGIAGIVGSTLQSLLHGSLKSQGARVAFLVGLVAAAPVWALFRRLPAMTSVAGAGVLVAAGLLVGVGTRMGNGCTSGHGVRRLSRFSPRSLANVVAFMAAGVVAVYVVRHWL